MDLYRLQATSQDDFAPLQLGRVFDECKLNFIFALYRVVWKGYSHCSLVQAYHLSSGPVALAIFATYFLPRGTD